MLNMLQNSKTTVFLELRDIAIKMVSLESGPEAVVVLSHEPERGFWIVVVEAMEELNRRLTGSHLHLLGISFGLAVDNGLWGNIFQMFLSLTTIINLFYNVAQYKCECIVCDCIRNKSIK